MAFLATPLRGLLVGLLLAAVAVAGVDTLPAAASSAAEDRLLARHNEARASAGLPALQRDAELDRVAAGWTNQMRDDYEAAGDRHATLRHNPNLAGSLPGSFDAASENVGFTVLTGASDQELADRLHEGYMNSDGHRANIMGDYDRVGVAKRAASDGTMWSTVVFLSSATPPPEPDPEPAPEPEPESAPEPQDEPQSSSDTGEVASGATSQNRAQEDGHDTSEAPADPVTAADLFGADWPDGLLAPGALSDDDLLTSAAARFLPSNPTAPRLQLALAR